MARTSKRKRINRHLKRPSARDQCKVEAAQTFFYERPDMFELFASVVDRKKNNKAPMSIRALERFVFTWAPKNKPFLDDGFNLCAALEDHKRRRVPLDFNRRGPRHVFRCRGSSRTLVTTLGQACAFMFVLSTSVWAHALKYLDEVSADMRNSTAQKEKTKKQGRDAAASAASATACPSLFERALGDVVTADAH